MGGVESEVGRTLDEVEGSKSKVLEALEFGSAKSSALLVVGWN